MANIRLSLSYNGEDADDHQLDFYDAAIAMVGFQRSLAITTHLVMNGQVITQAPSLKNASIRTFAPQAGSWELAVIIATGLGTAWKVGTAPKDTVIGHLVRSAYDYVVSSVTGVHVDFEKTIGAQLDEERSKKRVVPDLRQSQLESVAEKCYVPVRDMHRPIAFSKTASAATILVIDRTSKDFIGPILTEETYKATLRSIRSVETRRFRGRVSSYNVNTFKGRIYIEGLFRPIPFEIARQSQNELVIRTIASSLSRNARSRKDRRAIIEIVALPAETRMGVMKSLLIYQADRYPDE